jgi:hypothetical protein
LDSVEDQINTEGLQKEVLDACLAVVNEYRAGTYMEAVALLHIHAAFPEDLDENMFIGAFESYVKILNNFDQFRDSTGQQGTDEGGMRSTGAQSSGMTQCSLGAHTSGTTQCPADGHSKCARSPAESDFSDDGYKKHTCLDFNVLPWNQDAAEGSLVPLSPSLQKTQSLLANFARGLKHVKISLLNCSKSYPQFPNSEWGSILSGKSVDFNHVLSGMYSESSVMRTRMPN